MKHMNIKGLLWLGMMMLFCGQFHSAYALMCMRNAACTTEATRVDVVSLTGCAITTSTLWGDECIRFCSTCNNGYTLTDTTYTGTCSNSTTVQYCSSGTSSCSAKTYSSSTCGTTPAYTLSNCSSSTKKCFGSAYVQTCDTCKSGYTRTSTTYKPSGCSNSYTYYYCKSSGGTIIDPDDPFLPIDPSDACDSDADCGLSVWLPVIGTRYESKKTYTCQNPTTSFSSCVSSTSYRCTNGYYGSGTSCSPCPSPTDTLTSGSVTSAAGTTAVTGCYLTSGSVLKDSAGNTYDFTADCSYSN